MKNKLREKAGVDAEKAFIDRDTLKEVLIEVLRDVVDEFVFHNPEYARLFQPRPGVDARPDLLVRGAPRTASEPTSGPVNTTPSEPLTSIADPTTASKPATGVLGPTATTTSAVPDPMTTKPATIAHPKRLWREARR